MRTQEAYFVEDQIAFPLQLLVYKFVGTVLVDCNCALLWRISLVSRHIVEELICPTLFLSNTLRYLLRKLDWQFWSFLKVKTVLCKTATLAPQLSFLTSFPNP